MMVVAIASFFLRARGGCYHGVCDDACVVFVVVIGAVVPNVVVDIVSIFVLVLVLVAADIVVVAVAIICLLGVMTRLFG